MQHTTHLKSLQALEMAIRLGSLTAAAKKLAITPAAVGKRIRSLEEYLGTDLLLRGRSGLHPTPELQAALVHLQEAFAALDRATEALDYQRASEIQIVADPDWAELWLAPRLPAFREQHPNVRFCVNGVGDVPLRVGSPDLRIAYGDGPGEPLYTDVLVPLAGPENLRRIVGKEEGAQLEGLSLLHLKSQREGSVHPGWVEWCGTFGQRQSGLDRGVRYQHARLALEAVRQEVGFLICGLSLTWQDVEAGRVAIVFPVSLHLLSPHPYRLVVRSDVERRPPIHRFVTWLRREAGDTRDRLEKLVSSSVGNT
jgi:LysR family transcriptional regulator, glycine cleavage system transcriptional activator